MSATVTVGAATGQNPTSYPCQVSVNGGSNKAVTVVVSAATLALVPVAQQSAYVQARAMLAADDAADATATVMPFSDPANPTWADAWLAGNIPS